MTEYNSRTPELFRLIASLRFGLLNHSHIREPHLLRIGGDTPPRGRPLLLPVDFSQNRKGYPQLDTAYEYSTVAERVKYTIRIIKSKLLEKTVPHSDSRSAKLHFVSRNGLIFQKRSFLQQIAQYLSVKKTRSRCSFVVSFISLVPPSLFFPPICTVSCQTEACVPDQGIALMLAASREAHPSIPSDTPAAALP